ncbi:hypothetical protein HPC49_03715 [Pyxidicoccus fallax]|uniref:Uncharacterized protein n=1 Tax=Pyxidicoccus fallax TaxID=394095 RepID=A0A848LR24_9BACT|nr:hypothetical protein [Pyxidicoccus fallax]NMO20090.1 hypothetical protein [Pyxidicoccus fallax]NPC77358.1 hypothetical protein [Pyxidicoccus fallax]
MRQHQPPSLSIPHGGARDWRKAGSCLLALGLALSACTTQEAPAPAEPTTTQSQAQTPGDGWGTGPYHGRPARLGTCDREQTRTSYQQSDTRWEQDQDSLVRNVSCRTWDGSLQQPDAATCGHLFRGAPPLTHRCLSLQGSAGQETSCDTYNTYLVAEQNALRTALTQDATRGESLTPAHIFRRALEATNHQLEKALWVAYRVTSLASGPNAAQRFPTLTAGLPDLRSSCAPAGLHGPGQRGDLYSRYFLLAAITRCHGSLGEDSGHLAERVASYEAALGDPDRATAYWEGVKLGTRLNAFTASGGSSEGVNHCTRAVADIGQAYIGQSHTVALGLNDAVVPTSLLNRTPAVLLASVGEVGTGLSVTPLNGPYAPVSVIGSGPPGPRSFRYALTDGSLTSNEVDVTLDVQCPAVLPDWDPNSEQCTTQCGDCAHTQYCDTTGGTGQCVCPPGTTWSAPIQECLDCNCPGNQVCDASSGTGVCSCPPHLPNWNSTTQTCEPPSACGTSISASGGDAGYQRTFDLGATSGTLTLTFNTYSVKDRIRVEYEGATVIDTGCVGAAGTLSAGYSGSTTQAIVVVEANCAGSSGTQWNFTLGCGP